MERFKFEAISHDEYAITRLEQVLHSSTCPGVKSRHHAALHVKRSSWRHRSLGRIDGIGLRVKSCSPLKAIVWWVQA